MMPELTQWRAYIFRGTNFRYSCLIIFFLSIGIGLTSAFYASASTFLIKPFSFDRENKLFMVYQPLWPSKGAFMVSHPDIIDMRSQSRVLQGVAVYQEADKTIQVMGVNVPLVGIAIDREFFPLLGVAPALGREFIASDEMPGAANVLIISHSLWQRQFGGETTILGKAVLLDHKPYTIIGVMPSSFSFFSENTITEDIWLPLRSGIGPRENHDKSAIARMKPGVSIEQAQVELQVIARNIAKAYPSEKSYSFTLRPFRNVVLGDLKTIAWVLGVLSGGMLLIVCVNVAGVCLIEAQARRKEVELRTALGGSRWQVAPPFLVRALLRAGLGGASGVVVAAFLLRLIRDILPSGLPGMDTLQVDGTLLTFAACTAGASALVFGGWPAWVVTTQLQRIVLGNARSDSRASGIASIMWRSRAALVTLQTLFSAVFLTGAVLLSVGLWKLLAVDPGFEQSRRIVLAIRPSGEPHNDVSAQRRYYNDLEEKIAAHAGVAAIAITTNPPLGWSVKRDFRIKDMPIPQNTLEWTASSNAIANNYLVLMRIGVRAGRAFSSEDRMGSAPVAIVNEAFVQRFFLGRSPLRHYICAGEGSGPECPWREIVGVLADVHNDRLGYPAEPEYYIPWGQALHFDSTPSFVIQTALPESAMLESLRQYAQSAAPGDLVIGPETMTTRRERQLAFPRYRVVFAAAAAGLAIFFSTAGLYGLMSASLLQRRREMGIRLAVGATRRDISMIFIWQAIRWTAPAALLGTLCAAALVFAYGSFIEGISPNYIPAYVGSLVGLGLTAALATLLPVRRALQSDVMTSLRYD
jgi:putative ABC transport system permease protein